ncbi:MAG: radical SAM family heme chaperone HemW [Balneolaceae bacterium]|nr:radical SAM family heme chaperone HemW [Balneolaceae bacterium]
MSGIYIHIPFCRQACSYCDFYFVTQQQYRSDYVDSLVEEIRYYGDSKYAHEPVHTIYVGGGTPSLLKPAELERILQALGNNFDLQPQEITVEMNPDDVSADYLAALRNLGVNRSSMGVQSFKPELLEFMHRAHNRDDALRCLELLRSAEFDTFTVDLIYGNPGQSPDDLRQDLDRLLSFDPPHVSAYSLTIETGTRLGKQVELGRLRPPGEEKVAHHFDLVVNKLRDAGLYQYEVSNYSKPGHEAVHNSRYWNHQNYLGLGPAAHSFWWDEKATRWKNRPDLKSYLHEQPGQLREEEEELGLEELAEERLMLGLRTREGVTFQELEERYRYMFSDAQLTYLETKAGEGKIERKNGTIRFTHEGLKIADTLILDIVTLH